MNAPWLFAEAYKYRRLHECFSVSKFWRNYDVFYRQKVCTISGSWLFTLNIVASRMTPSLALPMLSLSYLCGLPNPSKSQENSLKPRSLKQNDSCSLSSPKVPTQYTFHEVFLTFAVLVCLWGNSTDLSLLINMTEDQIKSLQSTGGDHLAATEKNILGNDLIRLWETVKELREKTGGRIDFVLDNAGFELYCDCVYGICIFFRCYYLLQLVSQPISYCKAALRRKFVSTASVFLGLCQM